MITIILISIIVILIYAQTLCGYSCAVCSTTTTPYSCYQCLPGFFIQQNFTCESCMQGCRNCLSKYSCTQCLTSYALFQTVCVKCPQFCASCSIMSSKRKPTNVEQLTQYITCDECWKGFYQVQTEFDTMRCEACPAACTQCQNTTQCIQCAIGFGYNSSSNQCYSCGTACNECNNFEGCIKCARGYRQQKKQLIFCVPCQNNCLSCQSDGTCNLCSYEYYLVEGKCQRCSDPCIECSGLAQCKRCQAGFFLNQDSQCETCQEGCQFCSSQTQCSQCYSGYYLDSEQNCIECSYQCLHCLSGDDCLSCAASYYLKQGKCLQCLHPCASCYYAPTNDSTVPEYACSTCVSDQYLIINNHCVLCTSVDKYIGCMTCSDSLGCLTCIQGYEYVGGKCEQQGSMRVVYIVLISIAVLIGLAAVGFGIWACWKSRSGYGAAGESDANGVRSSYYEFP